MKFCMELGKTYGSPYKLCVKCCVYVNMYKHSDGMKF